MDNKGSGIVRIWALHNLSMIFTNMAFVLIIKSLELKA